MSKRFIKSILLIVGVVFFLGCVLLSFLNKDKKDQTLPDQKESSVRILGRTNALASTEKADLIKAKGVPDDMMRILESGVLRVGMCTIDQPPFHVKGRNGEFVGFDLDFARDIAATLNVKVQIVEGADWDTVVDMLLDGKADIMISNLSMTPERATRVLYSKPYAKLRQCLLLNRVLLARAGSEGLLTLRQVFEEYVENSLVIQEGTSCIAWASTLFPKAKITTTASWKEILDQILERKVLGTISDEIEIRKRMKEVQTMELLPVIIKGRYDQMVVGIPPQSPQLLHFVNAFIDSNNVQCDVENFNE